LLACIPLALRYHRGAQMSESTLGLSADTSGAEAGGVVEVAPRATA
jgi:hypothetical protein